MVLSPFATSSANVLFWTYVKHTLAPSRASACTIARPIPRLPPVTIATFPENISGRFYFCESLSEKLILAVRITRTGWPFRFTNSCSLLQAENAALQAFTSHIDELGCSMRQPADSSVALHCRIAEFLDNSHRCAHIIQ